MSVSRYATVDRALWTAPTGRQVPYLRRRLLPQPGTLATLRTHVVRPGERIDTIAASEIGDAEMSWLLGDANAALRPTELAEPGNTILIPLPAGVPGPASGQ